MKEVTNWFYVWCMILFFRKGNFCNLNEFSWILIISYMECFAWLIGRSAEIFGWLIFTTTLIAYDSYNLPANREGQLFRTILHTISCLISEITGLPPFLSSPSFPHLSFHSAYAHVSCYDRIKIWSILSKLITTS